MRTITDKLRKELEAEFSHERVEEGSNRFKWIILAMDCGEDSQAVLSELVIRVRPNSYRKYKAKLDLCGIRGIGLIPEIR